MASQICKSCKALKFYCLEFSLEKLLGAVITASIKFEKGKHCRGEYERVSRDVKSNDSSHITLSKSRIQLQTN